MSRTSTICLKERIICLSVTKVSTIRTKFWRVTRTVLRAIYNLNVTISGIHWVVFWAQAPFSTLIKIKNSRYLPSCSSSSLAAIQTPICWLNLNRGYWQPSSLRTNPTTDLLTVLTPLWPPQTALSGRLMLSKMSATCWAISTDRHSLLDLQRLSMRRTLTKLPQCSLYSLLETPKSVAVSTLIQPCPPTRSRLSHLPMMRVGSTGWLEKTS